MEVREAVAIAKKYLADLYAEEGIQNLGLEEARYDDREPVWLITLGFSRPWDRPLGSLPLAPARSYKIVEVSDSDGKVLAVRHRVTAAA